MRQVPAHADLRNYRNIFRSFIWYRNSVHIESGHPMIHGLFGLKDRTDRRPGLPIESGFRHFVRRLRDVRILLRKWIALVLEMGELWLQARSGSNAECRLIFELKLAREGVQAGVYDCSGPRWLDTLEFRAQCTTKGNALSASA